MSRLFHLYDCFVQISVSKSWCGEKIPAKNVLSIHSMSACPLSKCLLLEKRAIFVPWKNVDSHNVFSEFKENIKDAFWRECGSIEFGYVLPVVFEDFLRYAITRHFRSYGYEDKGKMYHFALARSTGREKKVLPLDGDKCGFFRLYHIKCEESNRVFEISYCQAKKGITLLILFFLLLRCGYVKNVIMICVYKNRRRFYYAMVGVSRSWQTCRSLARLCIHLHPSLKKHVCIPLRTCVRQKEVTSVCSCWTRW